MPTHRFRSPALSPDSTLAAALVLVGAALLQSSAAEPAPAAVIKAGFIYETAPFPQCHASTIAESKTNLVAAWFGGTREKHPDVGIWVARHDGRQWTAPLEVADGVQADPPKRYPCWNPVLFQPKDGPLLLFYKVGPSPDDWWGMLMTSTDAGKSWSKPRRLPEGILGPIKNKPLLLSDGALLCGSSTEHDGWRVHFELTRDLGQTWEKTPAINDGKTFGIIQPGFLQLANGSVIALMRSTKGWVYRSDAPAAGRPWSAAEPTSLPNPNAGIDAVTLADGRHLLVYNPVTKGRTPLAVAVSGNARDWQLVLTLEDQPGEYSYPAIIQAANGQVHVTYTWQRKRIKHVVIDPSRLPAQ